MNTNSEDEPNHKMYKIITVENKVVAENEEQAVIKAFAMLSKKNKKTVNINETIGFGASLINDYNARKCVDNAILNTLILK